MVKSTFDVDLFSLLVYSSIVRQAIHWRSERYVEVIQRPRFGPLNGRDHFANLPTSLGIDALVNDSLVGMSEYFGYRI